MADIPAGTVVAFAGTVEGDSIDQNPPLPVEIIPGWMLCNGAELDRNLVANKPLFTAIQYAHGRGNGNNFRLPDYRGYFLRGVDRGSGRDPDIGLRMKPNPTSGNDGNRVGSVQSFGTSMPNTPFKTSIVENHTHGDPTWNGQGGPYELAVENRGPGGCDYGAQSAPTTPAGEHSHSILGGDKETRPSNAYVNWIIKL